MFEDLLLSTKTLGWGDFSYDGHDYCSNYSYLGAWTNGSSWTRWPKRERSRETISETKRTKNSRQSADLLQPDSGISHCQRTQTGWHITQHACQPTCVTICHVVWTHRDFLMNSDSSNWWDTSPLSGRGERNHRPTLFNRAIFKPPYKTKATGDHISHITPTNIRIFEIWETTWQHPRL